MKAYFKKIAALTAAALLVLSMAACGGNDDAESTAPVDDTNSIVDNIPADDTNASDEDATGESDTAASNDTSDTAKTEDGTDKNTTSSNTDATTLSKEEAVALFNKATAGAKGMKGVRSTAVDINKLPGGLDMLKDVITGALKSSTADVSITGVPNQTMNASDFSSVTAKKSGNNWVLTMAVKGETAPNHAANTRAFAELPQKDIDEWINGKLKVKPADSIKFNYNGGTIVATVSADGKLINATYTMKVNVSVNNAKALGFLTISKAEVSVTQTDKF